MQIKNTSWLEDFSETCQDIIEDAALLETLAAYTSGGGEIAAFPQVLTRLSDYLSQHATDLRTLEKRLGLER